MIFYEGIKFVKENFQEDFNAKKDQAKAYAHAGPWPGLGPHPGFVLEPAGRGSGTGVSPGRPPC